MSKWASVQRRKSVLELLSDLDTMKSTDSDGISSRTLKCTSLNIADSLHKVNCSISQYLLVLFSQNGSWEGLVIPILKGSSNSLSSGYWPTSVLPVVSNFIEHHLKAIWKWIHWSLQWGFMSNLSTVRLKLWMTGQVLWTKGYEVCGILWCLKNLWCCISLIHFLILTKLNELGLDPYI